MLQPTRQTAPAGSWNVAPGRQMSKGKGVSTLHAKRQTPDAKRQTLKGGRQMAAYEVPVSAFTCVGSDGWPLDM